jgi:hypothetical protein
MNNSDIVLAYLKSGKTLTAMSGFKDLGIVSVRDYVSLLRRRGVKIFSEWRENIDTGKRWKEYFLIKERNENT